MTTVMKENTQKAVIFDFDGTLIHSLPDIVKNVNVTMERFGYKTREEWEVRRFIGNGSANLIKDCIGQKVSEQELAERVGFYNSKYSASTSNNDVVFDGIDELLFTLKKRGYKIAILTNKNQDKTEELVKRNLSQFQFDMVVGKRENTKCKPDKTSTLEILNKFGVDPSNAYFVGDGETDVMTAINAKVHGIAVLWGYRDKDELERAGATVFASSPKEVLKIIIGQE